MIIMNQSSSGSLCSSALPLDRTEWSIRWAELSGVRTVLKHGENKKGLCCLFYFY